MRVTSQEIVNKMADMEETGQATAGLEEDPAAAFLAREQDELADIAGDTLGFGEGDSEVSEKAEKSHVFIVRPPPPHTQTGQVPPQQQQDLGDLLNGDFGQEVRKHQNLILMIVFFVC